MNDATVKKVEMLESKPDYIMEPTRTGSFDDEMYEMLTINCGLYNANISTFWMPEGFLDKIEQQIADSHDITKSNFGFKP